MYKLFTQPFDDNKMIWDAEEDLYVLKRDYFKKRTGIDLPELLSGENQVDAFLLQISHRLYNIIFSGLNPDGKSNNLKVHKYILKHNHEKRDAIADALISFARAAIDTDIDRVGDEWELQGQLLNKTYKLDLPIDTERILYANGLMTKAKYGFEVED